MDARLVRWQRAGALMLLIGCGVRIPASALHPDWADFHDASAIFSTILSDPWWVPSHIALAVGAFFINAGLLMLLRATAERGVLRDLATYAALLTFAFSLFLDATGNVTLLAAGRAWAEAPVLEKAAALRDAQTLLYLEYGVLVITFTVKQGVALPLVTVALHNARRIPAWLAGAGYALAGVGLITGLAQQAVGVTPLLTNLVAASVNAAAYLFWSAVAIWTLLRLRRASG